MIDISCVFLSLRRVYNVTEIMKISNDKTFFSFPPQKAKEKHYKICFYLYPLTALIKQINLLLKRF
jgi:hypothetical protein